MPTEETPEECEACNMAVLGGITLSMCRELEKEEVDCEQLAQQFIDGELTIKDLVETVKKHTSNKDILVRLDEVESLARGDAE